MGPTIRVVQEILTEVRTGIQALDEHRLIAQPVATFSDVLREVSLAESVVAIRYHNVVAALMLGKPTVAISYGAKHDSLMTDAGFPEFCLPVKDLNHDRLVQAFSQVESRAVEIRDTLLARGPRTAKLLAEQFAVLSAEVLGA